MKIVQKCVKLHHFPTFAHKMCENPVFSRTIFRKYVLFPELKDKPHISYDFRTRNACLFCQFHHVRASAWFGNQPQLRVQTQWSLTMMIPCVSGVKPGWNTEPTRKPDCGSYAFLSQFASWNILWCVFEILIAKWCPDTQHANPFLKYNAQNTAACLHPCLPLFIALQNTTADARPTEMVPVLWPGAVLPTLAHCFTIRVHNCDARHTAAAHTSDVVVGDGVGDAKITSALLSNPPMWHTPALLLDVRTDRLQRGFHLVNLCMSSLSAYDVWSITRSSHAHTTPIKSAFSHIPLRSGGHAKKPNRNGYTDVRST